ncbi:endonuclease/exonuclease/phosphatase family protein [Allokutzneria albata]|uniref:Metal-dependent hydrolase, endonuclease/exonuclease/phosphatase family n=1 Tax=Allokutzneria albata TaxID=211114 RepID=A0A1H0CGB8_ALLAB|nr:endonuclease/exonuclease/phosphatase family protein [Allokutzneria albata]SDN56948.1 Metal-dependent hydrolase, endonuclease/exonuclease/phosphatase family [Allokutzneria albata]
MRIAGYNVMSGGFDGYDHETATPRRLPELKAAVAELRADVVGLIDTFRWDEVFTTEELGEHFGYEHVFHVRLGDERLTELGHDNGLTLLSNVELADVRVVRIATRNAIAARVLGEEELTIVLVYLDDLSEDVRLAQVRALAEEIDVNEPTIVLGDLNSLKAGEAPDLSGYAESNPAAAAALAPVVADMRRGEVVALLESLGLRDADPVGLPTIPTRLFPVQLDRALLRLDYCFHSPSVAVRDFAVPDSVTFQKASDHLPVVFDVA